MGPRGSGGGGVGVGRARVWARVCVMDPTVLIVCMNIKYWKVGKKKSSGRYIEFSGSGYQGGGPYASTRGCLTMHL